jgi:hypothetical protein
MSWLRPGPKILIPAGAKLPSDFLAIYGSLVEYVNSRPQLAKAEEYLDAAWELNNKREEYG